MNTISATDGEVSELAVFPLPSAVLFPGTILPLHVFEPRYQAMVNYCMAGSGLVAIAQLRDIAQAAHEQADIFGVAGLGKIIHADSLPEGRLNILVHGLERVRLLDEHPLQQGFRRFRAQVIPATTSTDLEAAARQLARLQSCVLSLRNAMAETDAQLCDVLQATSDPIALTDILGAAVVSDPHSQQQLLSAENFGQRIELLIDALADVMVKNGNPPKINELN